MLDRTAPMMVLIMAGLLGASHAHASAFQLKEKSAKALGRAFSGSISTGGDLAVIVDNPAAMSLLSGTLVQGDLSMVKYPIHFSGSGADALGRPLAGGEGGNAGAVAYIPAAYFHTQLNDKLHTGLALTAPFGFKTSYDRGWAGRYQGEHTEIQAINVTAALSYDLHPSLTVGGAVFLQHAKAKMRDALDFGAMLAAREVPGFLPTSADGRTYINADDNEWGYTLGVLFKPAKGTTFGFSYRSQVKHQLDDASIKFDVPANVRPVLDAAMPGWFIDTKASTALTMPGIITLSVTQDMTPQWRIMADVARTKWSSFEEVVFDFESAQADSVLHFNYKDTTFLSLGTEYDVSPSLTVRGGVAYDEAPVKFDNRDVRVPDANRTWLSLGASWRATPAMELSVGYTHLFVKTPRIDLVSVTGSTLTGDYDLTSDILAVSAAYRF